MTTYVAFSPQTSGIPWTGLFTLDGNSYKATANWNIAGQRWWLTLADSSGTPVWYGPIIGSPMDFDILLAPGIFTTSTLLYRTDTGNFETVP